MGFFGQFYAWLNSMVLAYIEQMVVRVAIAIEPAVGVIAVLYVMGWGFLQMTGRIQEPITDGLKRIALLAVVLGVSLRAWLYHGVIVDTFFTAPTQLAAHIVGAYDAVTVVDEIIWRGGDAADALIAKGSIFQGNFSFYFAGMAVYLLVGATAVYTMFLLALSRVALAILLSVGPLFLFLALFESTRRFLEAWLAQLANYALIAILTVMVAAFMLTLLTAAARDAAEVGSGIQIADAVRVGLASGLTLLVMRQVLPLAAGLASGIALSTYGLMGAAIAWGTGRYVSGIGQFVRGAVMDKETTRWDPLARKAGYYSKQAIKGARARFGKNSVRPSIRG